MEKIGRIHQVEYKYVVLYLEDIEKIAQILSRLTEEITIETEEYRYDNIEEFLSSQEVISTTLRIESRTPHFTLSVSSWRAEVVAFEDTPASVGTFHEIKDIFLKRRRLAPRILARPFSPTWLLALSLFVYTGISLLEGKTKNYVFPFIISCLLVGLHWYYTTNWIFKRGSIVHLYRRSEKQNILIRSKDQAFIAVISAIVGASMAWLLSKI